MTTQSLDSDVELLRTIPFFHGFAEEHLKLIAFSAESRSLPDKLLLYDEGQLLHSAYVIASGSLRGQHKIKDTDRIESRQIGPGVILGERALILDVRADEAVRVESRTRVLQIRKVMFRRLLQEYPEIAVTLRTRMTREVIHTASALSAVAERLKAMPV